MSRWIVGSAVLVLVAVLILWIARNTYWEEISIPQPPRGEAATNPFYSASRLATLLGAHPRWQRVLGSMPPRDAVVLASAWHWGLLANRRERLQQWVASGGRLVMDSSLIGGQRELEHWAGLSRYVFSGAQQQRFDREKWHRCKTLTDGEGSHPASGGWQQLSVCGFDHATALRSGRKSSWALRDGHSTLQVVRVAVGLGSVTLVNATPFGNSQLLEGDNAALFVAATQLRGGDAVWFLTEEKGASLLSLIWTTGAPAVLLLAAFVAAWLWRSSERFGPPIAPTEPARRSLGEQIRGTGQFTLRFGGGHALHAAQVRALQETADRRIPGYSRLSVPQRIEQLARLVAIEPGTLAAALDPQTRRRPGELRHGLALLESIRRTLSHDSHHRERS